MLGLLAWPRKSIWKNAQNRVGEEMALVVCKTQKENDEIAVDAKERQRFVRGVVKDLVSSFILLTLLQFLYTLAITDQDKKRLCNR